METPESFWSQPDLVASYSRPGGALDYERDAVEDAVARARRTGPVRTVHVLGIGAGRELPAIRELVGSAKIVGWDISAPMVEACRSLVEREGIDDVELHQGDLLDVARVGDEPADVLIALGAVLGYLSDPPDREAATDALRRLARTGAGLAAVVQQRAGRPDWATWFALRSVAQVITRRGPGHGNRRSWHADQSTRFHHYTRRELAQLTARHSFTDVEIRSLRQWARGRSDRLPLRSPNPLILNATAS